MILFTRLTDGHQRCLGSAILRGVPSLREMEELIIATPYQHAASTASPEHPQFITAIVFAHLSHPMPDIPLIKLQSITYRLLISSSKYALCPSHSLPLAFSSSLVSTARTSMGGLRPSVFARLHRLTRGIPIHGPYCEQRSKCRRIFSWMPRSC
jgi:hypothetical protein